MSDENVSGGEVAESGDENSKQSSKQNSKQNSKQGNAQKVKSNRKVAGPTQLSEYAVVRTGGRQYVVSPGMKLYVDKIEGEVGQSVELNEVLLLKNASSEAPTIGTPLVSGAIVKARVLAQERDKKILIFKKKRRKGYTKKQGHRQYITQIEVQSL